MPTHSSAHPGSILLTCEHAGNRVPPVYRPLFHTAAEALASHRGWDPGALSIARRLARLLPAPLIFTPWTRLLVEVNRSPHHPRLWSEFTRPLTSDIRKAILDRYYYPHRERVEAALREGLERSRRPSLHLGVHSFSPALDGVVRKCDVGLLFDPRRPAESRLCRDWAAALRTHRPDWRIRLNYPYRGASDGLTTHLRRRLGPRYLGVELEFNQAMAIRPAESGGIARSIAASLQVAMNIAGLAR